MKGWDHRALEGLPLKLLIMSLLLSLAAPAVLSSMDGFERSTARTQLTAEATRLGNVIEEVRSAGDGNRRILTISLPPTLARFSMALEVGGQIDSSSALSIRCSSEGGVFATIVLDDPPARVASSDLSVLRLEAGVHRLVAECRPIDGRMVVVVEVLE